MKNIEKKERIIFKVNYEKNAQEESTLISRHERFKFNFVRVKQDLKR